MGCINNGQTTSLKTSSEIVSTNTLTVATLNYCGIMNSPYEFYCDDYLTELKDISKQFVDLIPTYFPNFDKTKFKWEMGKIDQKFRTRYSPMFHLRVGIENDKFLSRQGFERKWEQVFAAEMPKLKIPYNQQEKEATLRYDVTMFHCLLKYVYKITDLSQAETLDVKKYITTLQPLFNQSFLNQERKREKVQKNFSQVKADIFFFQEYSQGFFKAIKEGQEYHVAHDDGKDTLIIAKKSSFKGTPATNEVFRQKHIPDKLWKQLSPQEGTALMVIDNYICLSAHLTSKVEGNKLQIKELKEGLLQLKHKLPDYDIILGGDLNSFLENYTPEFYFFPDSPQQMTTVKKRTSTQGQYHKAEKIINESKDKIISTLPIENGKITYITGSKPSKENLVPTNQHPFDHFVVVAEIKKRSSR